MGNWRRVKLDGYCLPEEVDQLREACKYVDIVQIDDPEGIEKWDFHCLTMTEGLMGLGNWVADNGHICRVGNLAERGFVVADLLAQWFKLLKVAPSLNLWCHVGGEYEHPECVASIRIQKGTVELFPPKIEVIPEIPISQGINNFFKALFKPRG